jgi:uncharacterized phosphosugar-binding protein
MTAGLPEMELQDVAEQLLQPTRAVVGAELDQVQRAADEIARRIARGGRLLTFGAGHSWSVAAEFCHRAGGLPDVKLMSLDDIVGPRSPQSDQLSDSEPERQPVNGSLIAERYRIGEADAVVIASNSGRNGAIVELALRVRERGAFLCGIVSLEHSAVCPSRHPSGRKLTDLCAVVLDNHGPVGDAAIDVGGTVRCGATSGISGALLAQLLVVGIVRGLRAEGIEPPLLLSANVDQPTQQ